MKENGRGVIEGRNKGRRENGGGGKIEKMMNLSSFKTLNFGLRGLCFNH